MTSIRWFLVLMAGCFGAGGLLATSEAQAQVPMSVTTVQPAAVPIVSFVPERRGLFGLQTVYRPVVAFAAPAPAPVVVASPVVQAYYGAPVLPPVTVHRMPVTSFRVATPTVVAPAPVTVFSPPVQFVTPMAPVFVP